ncbi:MULTISPECIES: PspA/IM30 family protein [Gammaproteobacteria]|uniref:PspA/IM30 family protein n=1 Tax=Gammaproteobacteria TaxID=1236 RepID=UPI001ADA37FA|nr:MULTISPECIES: PspA/IM30 family protein [Gammaproteobacteria]MBO9483471.1 PspA/IM30 family protein [Salinisphaera sp. G21_0]MBO9494798.1 PspA/IM30 family protein [Thalassotalea sp. G20_0]
MSIWSKVMTALKGATNEVGEAIADSNALRILDQEIREASDQLQQSKTQLAGIMAKQKLSSQKCAELKEKVAEYEGYAIKALDQGDESLATEVASKIAEYEAQLNSELEMEKSFAGSIVSLKKAITDAEANLRRLKQQVDTVKATESVQKAQAACAAKHSGVNSKMATATDSLERIKQRQAERAAQMEAASELSGDTAENDLQAKLKAAGITRGDADASSVLERLKARQG